MNRIQSYIGSSKWLWTALAVVLLSSCSSTKLVREWKSPDTDHFEANKVLVIGMAKDSELRRQFENELTSNLEKHDVIAVRSVDFFEQSFTDEKHSEAELDAVESRLLDAGFDAILFSKVVGIEEKASTVQSIREFSNSFRSFKEDYYRSQELFEQRPEVTYYKLYHAETNLYCICPDKERELLWSGSIEVVENKNRNKSLRDYVKTLVSALQNTQLLIVRI
ncbi:MAG: hypothetical protein AAF466_12230 [Bacteroidota bacterium]